MLGQNKIGKRSGRYLLERYNRKGRRCIKIKKKTTPMIVTMFKIIE